ncbi:MAG: helix-turn-helix transcriptional regulator [Lachnospiraceae bacterium]|nr:helix-turn-helix transcriptional regulator [Lachnospiraceae bacterium]
MNAEILTLSYDDMEQLLWNHMNKMEQHLLIKIAAFGEITLSQTEMLCSSKKELEYVSVILRHMPYISYNDKQTYVVQEILQEFSWIQYDRMKKEEQRKICVELENVCEKTDMLFALCRRPIVALRFIISLFLQGKIYSCKKFIWQISDMQELCNVISIEDYQCLKDGLKLVDAMISFMDMKNISDIFKEVYRNLERNSLMYTLKNTWTFASPSVVCFLWKKSGLLDEAQKSLMELLSCYPRLKFDYGIVTDVILNAEIHFLRGEFLRAKEHCIQVMVMAQKNKHKGICITAEFILARVAMINGNKNEFLKALNHIEQYERDGCKKEFQQMAILCRDYLNMLLEQYDEISFWMKDKNDIDEHIDYPIVPFAQIISASLMYVECRKRYIDNNTYCTRLMELCIESDERHMLLPKIYYYIFESMVKNDIGDINGAKNALKKALDYAICDKVYVPFAEFYSYISGILDKIALEYGRFDDISNIVKLGKMINQGKLEISGRFSENKQHLSHRELEIAGLLRQRLTCKEIADKLNISVNTVRNITQNIYQKLEIHSKKDLMNV